MSVKGRRRKRKLEATYIWQIATKWGWVPFCSFLFYLGDNIAGKGGVAVAAGWAARKPNEGRCCCAAANTRAAAALASDRGVPGFLAGKRAGIARAGATACRNCGVGLQWRRAAQTKQRRRTVPNDRLSKSTGTESAQLSAGACPCSFLARSGCVLGITNHWAGAVPGP
jgi:hypothetical protein